MEKTGLIDKLQEDLFDELAGYEEERKSAGMRISAQHEIVKTLQEVNASDDIHNILSAEKILLVNDLKHYAKDKDSQKALQSSIERIAIAHEMVDNAENSDKYKIIAEAYKLKHHKVDGLPKDEARQFFTDHAKLLAFVSNQRFDQSEKDILARRRNNIINATNKYIRLQRKALISKTKTKQKSQSQDLSR